MQFAACTIKAAPLQTTGTHNMTLTDLELETLRKFNSGTNSKQLTNDLEPGSYDVKLTVSIEGQLLKGNPGITRSRDTTGTANILQYLLDRINSTMYSRLLLDLPQIRKGNFEVKHPDNLAQRIDGIMPYREYPRQGSTRFNGQVIAEDLSTDSNTTWPTGLQLSGSNND
tara:strand:+ start:3435 stop:3944 length:510 start_codon:yes stop_codon:yes gene_type:complete